jgi:hypothetical protein
MWRQCHHTQSTHPNTANVEADHVRANRLPNPIASMTSLEKALMILLLFDSNLNLSLGKKFNGMGSFRIIGVIRIRGWKSDKKQWLII